MRILGIVPARGGSKGIFRKNIRPVAGRPLLGWMLEAATACGMLHRLIVSTDDPNIAAIAQAWGAEVIWRPAELATDIASSEEAVLHALHELQMKENYSCDLVVMLQCTAPLTTPSDIAGTIEAVIREQADCGLTVAPFHYFLWRVDEAGNLRGVNHDPKLRLPRQLQKPCYLETGAVYVMRTEGFLQSRHRFFGKIAFHVVPRDRVLEIDDPIDLEIADFLLSRTQMRAVTSLDLSALRAVVMDFDGVLTDNSVFVTENGLEMVRCNRSDGAALAQLKTLGIKLLILSSEENPVVALRCRKVGVPFFSGVRDKLPVLSRWLEQEGISPKETAYLGNDTNDLECMHYVGYPIAVADAWPEVKLVAKLILSQRGGYGALRELTSLILKQRTA